MTVIETLRDRPRSGLGDGAGGGSPPRYDTVRVAVPARSRAPRARPQHRRDRGLQSVIAALKLATGDHRPAVLLVEHPWPTSKTSTAARPASWLERKLRIGPFGRGAQTIWQACISDPGNSQRLADDSYGTVGGAKAARRQLNVRVLEQTAYRLQSDTLVIAGTHSTGDVIDWLVEHHLADAVQALSSTSTQRRQGVRPRR